MTTNPYFRKNVPSEQKLADSLTVECIQVHGQDFLYIPRETVSEDDILGESVSRFTDANRIEMYFDTPGSGFAPSPPSTLSMRAAPSRPFAPGLREEAEW